MRVAKKSSPGVEELKRVVLIRGEHATMRQGFVDRPQSHAEVEVVQRTGTKNAVFPPLSLGDQFDFFFRAQAKGHPPVIASQEPFGFGFGLDPLVA